MRIKKKVLKQCSKCGSRKPLSEFNKDSRGVHGVRSDCKSCRSKKKPKELHKPFVAESKDCRKCGETFKPNSNRQIWCLTCGEVEKKKLHRDYCKKYHAEHYERIGYSHLVGENANAYKTGIGIYSKVLKDGKCNRCGSARNLLTHHRDRNRHNNKEENLERLCKACHQEEHLIRDGKGRYIGSK